MCEAEGNEKKNQKEMWKIPNDLMIKICKMILSNSGKNYDCDDYDKMKYVEKKEFLLLCIFIIFKE